MRLWPWPREHRQVQRLHRVPQDAVNAKAESQKRLEEAREMKKRAEKVAGDLQSEGRRNHFGELIQAAWEERR